MANIQTIRLVYHTAYLSEKEYIKTFLEFIGFQILEEPYQLWDELTEALKAAAPSYDLDIWLNLRPAFDNDDNVYNSWFWHSKARNVIALDYFFSKEEESKDFSVRAFSKNSKKDDKTFENVQTKEELRRKVLEKLVEQLWYVDTEKQEEMQLLLDLYLNHNIFVCLQSLTSLSLARVPLDCIGQNRIQFRPSEFWEFCLNGFIDLFNELQPISETLKSIYALYAFANTAFICLKLFDPTRRFDNNRIYDIIKLAKESITRIIKKMRDMDKYFVGIWYLASLNASLDRDTDWEVREYLYFIIEKVYGKGLNDGRFISKYCSMLGDYFLLIGGNDNASKEYYEAALRLNEKNIQANFMIAKFDAHGGRYDKAEYRFLNVLKLLGSPKRQFTNISPERTTDYEAFFKTCIWLAKVYYNRKRWGDMAEMASYIYAASSVVRYYKECPWIVKIVDDEPIWKMLQEHYKNGAPTCNLCSILAQWEFLMNDDHFNKLVKSITPPKENNPHYISTVNWLC